MLTVKLMVGLLFFAVGTVVLTSGIFTRQSNHKAPANRAFFALSVAIAIWSSGIALSTPATDAVIGEIFRRVSAIDWNTAAIACKDISSPNHLTKKILLSF